MDNVEVTLMDANHCPGAVIFLFKVNGEYYLHTGDFRYHPSMKDYPQLQGIQIKGLFLDNTFCDPHYVFPPQKEAIKSIVDIVRKDVRPYAYCVTSQYRDNTTLFLVGSYLIGKERVYLALAKEFKTKIYVTIEKFKILSHLQMDMSIFTTSPSDTNIHVVDMGTISPRSIQEDSTLVLM